MILSLYVVLLIFTLLFLCFVFLKTKAFSNVVNTGIGCLLVFMFSPLFDVDVFVVLNITMATWVAVVCFELTSELLPPTS